MRQECFNLVDAALEHYKAAEGLCYRLQDSGLSIPYSCVELSKSVMAALSAFIAYYSKEQCTNICDAYKLVSTECPVFGATLWLRDNIMLLDSWMFQSANISRSELKLAVFHIGAFLSKNGISKSDLTEGERRSLQARCQQDYYLKDVSDSALRFSWLLMSDQVEDCQQFYPEKYFKVLHIKDEDAEMLRLTEVYNTSDAEVLLSVMKSIYELYTNTMCS